MKKKKKLRADIFVLECGLAPTLSLAQAYIMAGKIAYQYNNKSYPVEKAGMLIPEDAHIYIKEEKKYVSRGGYKLEKGLRDFSLDVHNKICLDIGASTGGFTDCLLQHGAQRIYAIDVGEHLLHEKLVAKNEVISKKINIKYLLPQDIGENIDIVVADISFISLEHIFKPLIPVLAPQASMLLLLKPQFELPQEYIHKGIVRDPSAYLHAIEKITHYATQYPVIYKGYTPAGIKGKKGNQEYLLYFSYQDSL